MPLVVPALRLLMLFFNVFETYKTMKPARSTRRGGRPSVRAVTQRKRDMKGCLAVWIVWCCLAVYERMFESFFSLVVPFYSEIKSILLLFFIITRARGAEPIYLHLIRPMIKPYTSTVDSLLDLARMFGDIAFIVITVPTQYGVAWWNGKHMEAEETKDFILKTHSESPATYPTRSLEPVELPEFAPIIPEPEPEAEAEPEPDLAPAPEPAPASVSPAEIIEVLTEEPQSITRTNSINESVEGSVTPSPTVDEGNSQADLEAPDAPTLADNSTSHRSGSGAPSIASSTSVDPSLQSTTQRNDGNKRKTRRNGEAKVPRSPPKPHEQQLYRYQLKEAAPKVAQVPVQPKHEIWLPPASAHEDAVTDAAVVSMESSLENSRVNISPSPSETEAAGKLTVDEWRLYDPFPSAYPPTPLPAVPAKLTPASSNSVPPASRRPSVQIRSTSDGGKLSSSRTLHSHPEVSEVNGNGRMSDSQLSTTAANESAEDSSNDGEGMNDSEDDSEDDFNATLQTPLRQRNETFPSRRPQLTPMASDSSIDSSTKLSTVDRGSTYWPRSSSESESSESDSLSDELASAVRRKRPNSKKVESQSTLKLSVRAENKQPLTKGTVNDTTVRGRGRGHGQAPIRTSSRLANAQKQAPRLTSASSQGTVAGGRTGRVSAASERSTRGRP